ncbi:MULTISPECIES: NlpC/P60 family protein [unclassified Xanthobacter]|uniref:NlpC/P60 family protein n=1 Tax=unclassified Xanthobacter TaxID=2623496 RepID=UPI001EE05620|nr:MULTISPECIES: NlpC/P60 family protein [unclassified Xanthobacter]
MTRHWSAPYLGLPFRLGGRDRGGVDCYGLVVLAYTEVLGVSLPSFTGHYTDLARPRDILAALDVGRVLWRRVERPRAWDVALFDAPCGCHVGLMVDAWRMLHVAQHHDSRIERVDAPAWRARGQGVYRWEGAR